MAELVARLRALKPTVEKIRTLSGTTGVSIGVIHDGQVLLTENFGYRDVKAKIPPNQDTIYYLASLSKSFTAAGIAQLIHQRPELNWDTPVSEAYPPLSHEDSEIRRNVTILDFLSHRTGLAPKNHIWSQEYGHFTLRRGEDIRTVTYLEKIAELRSRFIYNNWGYAVADELIEHLGGMTYGDFLKTYIFDPLSLARTVTTKQEDDDNVAKAYVALADGTPWEIEEPDGEDGEILAGALAVRSCVRDLLQYYIAFMQAVDDDQKGIPRKYTTNPFIDAAKMVKPYIKLSTDPEDYKGTYGLGWVSTRLPCTLGALGMNHDYVGKMPMVGHGIPQQRSCCYHQGSANSFLSSVFLLPETHSGVVVLTNSMSQNDAADWLGELYLQTIIDPPEKNDYIQLASSSAEAAIALWPGMREELLQHQIPNTPIRPLDEYVGVYYNRIGNYHIAIDVRDGKLLMRFQREKNIAYDLTHYHYDTFSWLITHDHDAKLGRFPITRATFYIIRFDSYGQENAAIDSLIWAHDDMVLEGERFVKRPGQSEHIITEEPSDHPEPAPGLLNPGAIQLAEDVGGRTEVFIDDKARERDVAVVQTELEDRSSGVVTVGASRNSENGKL